MSVAMARRRWIFPAFGAVEAKTRHRHGDAEDIGRFPDAKLAESVQRIPDVQITRSRMGNGTWARALSDPFWEGFAQVGRLYVALTCAM